MTIEVYATQRVGEGAVEYSSVCPFSQDNRWLLIQAAEGRFALYTGEGHFVELLPPAVTHHSEPRWSRAWSDILFFVKKNALIQYDVQARNFKSVHTFTEYDAINSSPNGQFHIGGESDLSLDGKHLVMVGTKYEQPSEVFVFDIEKKTKGDVFLVGTTFDGLKISGKNVPIVSKADGIWTLEIPHGRHLFPYNAHAAVGRDENGDDCLFVAKSDDRNEIVKVRIADGYITTILYLGWAALPKESMAVHISACDDPRFCIVATYGIDKTVQYANQILRVATDGSGVEVLCDSTTILRDYTSQPKAALSRDGSRCVFNVDDGQQVGVRMVRLDETTKPEPAPKPDTSEQWEPLGALPYDEESDIVCFNSRAKNVSVYRRKKP